MEAEDLRPLGARLARIPLGRMEYNGLVERSHRTDDEEFYLPRLGTIGPLEGFLQAGSSWVYYYNYKRIYSGAGMEGHTPYGCCAVLSHAGLEMLGLMAVVLLDRFVLDWKQKGLPAVNYVLAHYKRIREPICRNETEKSMKKLGEGWVALAGALILTFLFFYNRDSIQLFSWLGLRGDDQPFTGWEGYVVVNSALLLWIPLLIISLIGHGELSQYGLARGDGKNGAIMALAMIAAMAPLVWFASARPEFQAYYPLDKRILNSAPYAIYFSLMYGYYLFCWEFFFRGFLTFGLHRWIGSWGIVVQACAFGLMHVGKPSPEMLGSFVAGLILGWVAIRVKSFLPCFWAHWAVSLLMDLMMIYRNQG